MVHQFTDHPGDVVLQSEYHRVTKDPSGGYALEYLSDGQRRNVFIQPGDDANQFSDEFWACFERGTHAAYLGEYLCDAEVELVRH